MLKKHSKGCWSPNNLLLGINKNCESVFSQPPCLQCRLQGPDLHQKSVKTFVWFCWVLSHTLELFFHCCTNFENFQTHFRVTFPCRVFQGKTKLNTSDLSSVSQIKVSSSSAFDVIVTETGSCLPTQVVVSVSTIVSFFTQIDSKSKAAKLVKSNLSCVNSISKSINLSERVSLNWITYLG